MQSLPMTLLFASLGFVLITIGFVFGQDEPQNAGKKWYQVLKEDLLARSIFWISGLGALFHAGYLQFL